MEPFQQVLDILIIHVVASLSSLHISQKLAPCILGIGVLLMVLSRRAWLLVLIAAAALMDDVAWPILPTEYFVHMI